MKYCENCGNQLSDAAKFCSNCGEKVNSISHSTEVQSEETISLWSIEKFIDENPPNEKGILTCPKCFGKGIVDKDDVKRLSLEHNLVEGDCLYCDGVGLVNIKKISREVGEETQQRNNQLQKIFSSLIDHKRIKDPFPELLIAPRYDFGSPIRLKDGAGIR